MTETEVEQVLRAQWDLLVAWLRDVGAESRADLPSGLAGWTVGDLVAHLGYGIAMVTEVEPAPDGTAPIGLGRYVGGYRAAAPIIEAQSQQLRRDLEPGLIDGIEALADVAWAGIGRQQADVVVGRRGPLTWPDYLLTRLIELVVHADDLERALGAGAHSPVSEQALAVVAEALAAARMELRGSRPEPGDPRAWVRRAAGRVAGPDGEPPLLG